MESTVTALPDNGNRWHRLARRTLLTALTQLKFGQLTLQEGEVYQVFGDVDAPLKARVIVHDTAFYSKILVGGSIGAAEAYIDGLWDSDDLSSVVQVFAANLSLLDGIERKLGWLTSIADVISHRLRRNSSQGAKRNILAHYDLGNEFYQLFLDRDMLYSSAVFAGNNNAYHQLGADDLAQAQQQKMHAVCEQLDLQPGQTLLEIGTGWGALAIYAASHYGVHVTTTTISDAQYQYASERIAAAGLTDKITLLKQDYRLLRGQYDRIVSIEMIEAVGHEYLPGFFRQLNTLLKTDGRLLLQAITIADQRYDQYRRGVDFIQKYIFPGGCLPSISRMSQLLTAQTDMGIWSVKDLGLDYARTLKCWHDRFIAMLPQVRQLGYSDEFIRMWRFYLSYCEGGFLAGTTSTVHLVAVKPGYRQSQAIAQ
ncbi:cyclopropane-fatty-acyl-phospholipid synthase [Shewanella sp. NFH-SH190041]|uniref:SAM-dependent methyltransferase n=1 Tax=Shewanella sp. NFH-SH190041 TaxID=2950245 RepID=UPI0021C2D452|nr:cyclopropane-fatty-acyl-phospholipid synthase family protein [Shewanella sp. NFH-SH190041]BDM63539.1 cyclopropane-fatty-acyl-phospholipid synthase [Shewanella sp. NFH-SH190041]